MEACDIGADFTLHGVLRLVIEERRWHGVAWDLYFRSEHAGEHTKINQLNSGRKREKKIKKDRKEGRKEVEHNQPQYRELGFYRFIAPSPLTTRQ